MLLAKIGVVVIAMFCAAGTSVHAQSPHTAQSPSAAIGGPWKTDAVAGVSAASAGSLVAPMVDGPRAGREVAMMAVGAAAIVVGALIVGGTAGTIFVVGGAAVLLYGLYNYLQ